MIKQVATVAVYVEDQEKAKAFWQDKVGFEVRNEQSMGSIGSWLEVAPEGAQSRLVLYPRVAMDDWKERKPSIVFECEDVHGTYEVLKERGVEFPEEPKKMAWGTDVVFRDPDGNEFLLRD